jgi:hypothetical protein
MCFCVDHMALVLVLHLQNHVPLMYELYLAMKARQARKEPPSPIEVEIASGQRTADDPTAILYFKSLGAARLASAETPKVCVSVWWW